MPQTTPPTVEERLRSNLAVSRYPEFCAKLLDLFPNRHFVFFERDALPFKWVLEVFLAPQLHDRLHSIYLNSKMMPPGLVRALPASDDSSVYEERRKAVQGYGKRARGWRPRVIRFIQQVLAAVPVGSVLVDCGYWGTMPLLCQAALPEKKFEIFWFVGPPGAPVFVEDKHGPENLAKHAEHFFEFPYEAAGLTEMNGTIEPRIWQETYRAALFEEQRRVLLTVAKEWAGRHLAQR